MNVSPPRRQTGNLTTPTWHPEFALAVGTAQSGMRTAFAALQRFEGGRTTWSDAQSDAIAATESALGAFDAVLSQYEDLPEPLLDALVGAANESRRLLEQIQDRPSWSSPAAAPRPVTERYQVVIGALDGILNGPPMGWS